MSQERNMSISPYRFFITEYQVKLIHIFKKINNKRFTTSNPRSKVTKTVSAIVKKLVPNWPAISKESVTSETQQRNQFGFFSLFPLVFSNYWVYMASSSVLVSLSSLYINMTTSYVVFNFDSLTSLLEHVRVMATT